MTANGSKYKPEYCEKLIEHMDNGLSFEAFAGVVNVNRDTIFEWVKRHPEFAEAKKIATAKAQLYWEQMGINGLKHGSGFNSAVWIFNMKNRFGWRDKTETQFSGPDGGPIELAPAQMQQKRDYSKLSTDELKMLRLLETKALEAPK